METTSRASRASCHSHELGDHRLGLAALLLGVPGAAEVEVVPDLVEALGDVGVGHRVVAADQLGDRVDHLAHRGELRRAAVVGADAGREQPAQPALHERLHLRGRQARAARRSANARSVVRAARSGRTSCPGRRRARRRAASRARWPAAARRSGWRGRRVGDRRAQVGDQGRAATAQRVRSSSWACSAASGSELVAGTATGAPRRPRRRPRSRSAAAGPGSPRRRRAAAPRPASWRPATRPTPPAAACVGAVGAAVDQLLAAEQRAAPPQVGPDALLDVRDADDVPLEALGAVRGQDARRPRRRATARRGCRRGSPGRRGRRGTAARPACGSRSVNRAAMSNSATHGVEVAVGRRARAHRRGRSCSMSRSASPLSCQTVHSTASASPPRAATSRAEPDAAAPTRSAGARTFGWIMQQLARVVQRAYERGARRSRSPFEACSGRAARAAAGAGRGRRRRRSGPSTSSSAASSSSSAGRSAPRSSTMNGRAPGSLTSGTSSPRDDDRHAGGGERPAQRAAPGGPPSGPARPCATTGRSSSRCARRSSSATSAASWLALSATMTRTACGSASSGPSPAPAAAGRGGRRPGRRSGSRAATRREASRIARRHPAAGRAARRPAPPRRRPYGTGAGTPGCPRRRRRGSRRSTGRGRRRR